MLTVSRFRRDGATWRPDRLPRPALTPSSCPASKDREILWDGGHREAVRGFGVAAFRNGGKCYIAQYRKDGRSRRTRIGEHGRLTPEEARKQAETHLLGAVKRAAQDPVAQRRAAREVRTFKAVATDFIKLHVGKAEEKDRTNTQRS